MSNIHRLIKLGKMLAGVSTRGQWSRSNIDRTSFVPEISKKESAVNVRENMPLITNLAQQTTHNDIFTQASAVLTGTKDKASFDQEFEKYGFLEYDVPVYLYRRFIALIRENPDYRITAERLQDQMFYKDVTIMHSALSYAHDVNSYKCLLQKEPAMAISIHNCQTYEDFSKLASRKEAKGIYWSQWFRFYLMHFQPHLLERPEVKIFIEATAQHKNVDDASRAGDNARKGLTYYSTYNWEMHSDRAKFNLESVREALEIISKEGLTDEQIIDSMDGRVRKLAAELEERWSGVMRVPDFCKVDQTRLGVYRARFDLEKMKNAFFQEPGYRIDWSGFGTVEDSQQPILRTYYTVLPLSSYCT